MRNGRVARDLRLLQDARRETALRDSAQLHLGNPICRAWEAHILNGSSTDEQRRSSAKDRQPGGLFSGGRLAALLLSQRALRLSSFVAPCQPPARKQRAHSSFCFRLLGLRGGIVGALANRGIANNQLWFQRCPMRFRRRMIHALA